MFAMDCCQVVGRVWKYIVALPLVDRARQRRILMLLSVLWLLATIDLGFTLWAQRYAMLEEFNPIARRLFDNGRVQAVIAYKIATLMIGSTIFWITRRRTSTEVGLWGLAMVYVLVMFQWSTVTAAADEIAESRRQEVRANIPVILDWNAYLNDMARRPPKKKPAERITIASVMH